jgi:hypothetical protein
MCKLVLSIFDLDDLKRAPAPGIVIGERDGAARAYFDHDLVLRLLSKTFPGIVIGEEDLLLEEARRAEATLASEGEADNPLIGSLYRKAKDLGPATPFLIPVTQGGAVMGSVRRYDINFRYCRDTPLEVKAKLAGFLKSFAVGTVEEQACEE